MTLLQLPFLIAPATLLDLVDTEPKLPPAEPQILNGNDASYNNHPMTGALLVPVMLEGPSRRQPCSVAAP